jgi:hypothetical protein
VKTPKRLPSAREFALLTWDARIEVLSALRAIQLAYLQTEEIRGNDDIRNTNQAKG